jgi:hypothetical protein
MELRGQARPNRSVLAAGEKEPSLGAERPEAAAPMAVVEAQARPAFQTRAETAAAVAAAQEAAASGEAEAGTATMTGRPAVVVVQVLAIR